MDGSQPFETITKALKIFTQIFLGRATVKRISYLLSRIVQFQPDLVHNPLQFLRRAMFEKLPCDLFRAFTWPLLENNPIQRQRDQCSHWNVSPRPFSNA